MVAKHELGRENPNTNACLSPEITNIIEYDYGGHPYLENKRELLVCSIKLIVELLLAY